MTIALDLARNNSIKASYIAMVLATCNFARNNDLSSIELVAYPPFDAECLNSIVDEIHREVKSYDVTFHLPAWEINIGALNHRTRQSAVDETLATIDIASRIGASKTCLHPGSYGSMKTMYGAFAERVAEGLKESLNKISDYATMKGVKINLENLPFDSPLFKRPKELDEVIAPGMGVVLDTSHAVTSGIDPVSFIRSFADRIGEVHFVDGFRSQQDRHLPLGQGEVDFGAVVNELRTQRFEGPIVLEMTSTRDAAESLHYLERNGLL